MIQSIYLEEVLDVKKLKKLISRAKKELKPFDDRYEAVAFMGNSGAMFGPILAAATGKEMILVRKNKENSHSTMNVEGYINETEHLRYIIADDLVSSGKTLETIRERIEETYKILGYYKPECVGVVLYRTYQSSAENCRDLITRAATGTTESEDFFVLGLEKEVNRACKRR